MPHVKFTAFGALVDHLGRHISANVQQRDAHNIRETQNPTDHALQTQLYLHVATAKPNAQLDAYAPLISLDNSALHTLVPVTGTRGAWTAIHHTHS